ncbi:hypothetical protein T231_04325 [Tannerella sp. oral taxon BU063 isolate Cell 6/7/9]|uniref:Uncharacterized protein n=1 Tax=Tannerella sp. oral taxon BU063 isolate Cell 6/7/9 TaxID=1411021 RepID=W2CU00_9BACT|nr:hypothetical protein T231_04325 [Tannerella sp. oral taxon BU063 isolate Cell 6/7/9]
MLLSEGLEVIGYLFRVTRRTRDLCEVIEITPDGLWGQSLDFFLLRVMLTTEPP